MSTPSQPLCIWMINICIKRNSDITSKIHNSHLDSWMILWQNQHSIFLYLPNHQHAIGSLPGTLFKTLIPFLGAPQNFMQCGPGGAWIENCQSNPTQTLFVEGVFMTDPNDPCSSQKPNQELMFFTCYIISQYTATHHAINGLLSSCQQCLTGTPINNTIYELLGIISFITQPQSSDQDNWSPFILSSVPKGTNDILHFALRHLSLHHAKTTHLKSLPTISNHYELLPLVPRMQQEYYTLYKEFLSSKSKGPAETFRNINKLRICCNHHITLNRIADADLEDHKGMSTQDNSSTITQTIVDVEKCIMISKIEHLLKSLLKNKQSNCGPTKSVFYTQWTQFLNLIGIALAYHSIFSAQIDGTITTGAQEKALENFFNNPECEVLIASIAASGTGLNIACANIVYLMVMGHPEFYCDFWTLTSTFPGAQLEPSH
ncbi:hypothetical protein O181_032941 [Austropuccinia psidii MF-1]|uniref:Helicase C-terminal domain-containing protein n=1 Tax=Austropuccinia psidii MF-1 TaxID=1389203 RepID=A0A9Q3H6L6_9BASI|nr:hypothetical protein [Austropuccinia psidii MF-1]